MSIEYIFFEVFGLNLNSSACFQLFVMIFSVSGFQFFKSLRVGKLFLVTFVRRRKVLKMLVFFRE